MAEALRTVADLAKSEDLKVASMPAAPRLPQSVGENHERLFNAATLTKTVENQRVLDLDSMIMAKCTKSCFVSMKESSMLPLEKNCFRNCVVKSCAFNQMFA